MNMGSKKIIFLIVAFFVFTGNVIWAYNPADSTSSCTSISTEKILTLKTVWSESSNPSSLNYFDCDNRIGTAYIYFNSEEGNYHLYQQGNGKNQIGFFTDGYVKFNKWKFFGNFNYFNQTDKHVNWVDVMEPYNDNPYTLGDSIGGDYSKEYFKMQGKASYQLNKKFSFGFDVKYNAGVGAKRKDPRPENTITNFDILPGFIFDFHNIKVGANFRYEGSKEDITITTVTDNNFNLFHFKGLGVFTSTTEEDDRSSESDLFGGGLQINLDNHLVNILTEVNFYKKSTDIKRGKTYPLQVVLLEKFNTDVTSTFMFSPSGENIKKLKLFYNDKRLYGHEPVVEPKLEQVSYQWSTVAKYTLYWLEEKNYGINYSYYKITDNNHIDWGGTISGKLNSSETSYYFVPEYNRQILNLFYLDALLEKGYEFTTNEVVFSLNGGYRASFDSSMELVTEETLLSTVNSEFVTHDFNYLNSGLWQFGASVKLGRIISIYQSPIQVFLDTGYKLMVSDIPGDSRRNVFEIKLGMNF